MRRVAIRAARVGGYDVGQARGFRAVAPGAHAWLSLEVVRLVARETRVVARGLRARGFFVTTRAPHDGRARRLVRLVAVAAVLASLVRGMAQRALLVAARARLRRDRRCLVWVVALLAVDGRVLDHGSVRAQLLGVATDAGRRIARREGVARKAVGFTFAPGVRVRRLLGVAARADIGSRFRKVAFGSVAITAGDVAFSDVSLVPDARAKVGVRRRNVLTRHDGIGSLRKDAKKSGRSRQGEKEHGRCETGDGARRSTHHVPPWQRRQGRSRDLSRRLEKPGQWALPPGPPTRWQPPQSCPPAPPWHPAHETGSRRAWMPCCPPPRDAERNPGGCGLLVAVPGATAERV